MFSEWRVNSSQRLWKASGGWRCVNLIVHAWRMTKTTEQRLEGREPPLTLRQAKQYLYLATFPPVRQGFFPCRTALCLKNSHRAGPVLQEFGLEQFSPGIVPGFCLCEWQRKFIRIHANLVFQACILFLRRFRARNRRRRWQVSYSVLQACISFLRCFRQKVAHFCFCLVAPPEVPQQSCHNVYDEGPETHHNREQISHFWARFSAGFWAILSMAHLR